MLGIAASSSKDASGNKNVTFNPEYCYYDSNEWYALSKSDKYKVLKALRSINGGNNSSESGGHSNSGGGEIMGKGSGSPRLIFLRRE